MTDNITLDIHSSVHAHTASTLSLKSRSNLAVQHILAADYFTRKAGEIENLNAGKPFGDFYEEIIWTVSSAIVFSVMALEADVNEIFVDERWKLTERKSFLDKYERALFLRKKKRFDKGTSVYRNADNLRNLRNALIHFTPEWPDEKKKHKIIADRLKGQFQLSPFVPASAEFFPMKCMSHGCAEWSVKTALAFSSFFSGQTGLPDRFASHLSRINTR